MKNYKVLTNKSILDIDTENVETTLKFIESQNDILTSAGIDINDTNYIVRFFDSPFSNAREDSMTITDAVACLATKEGFDLVRFDNGNYGYISYYGNETDAFEIVSVDETE